MAREKTVGTHEFGVDFGDDWKLSAHLDCSDNQKSEARIETIYKFIECYRKIFKFFIEIAKGELNSIVLEENEFENRVESRFLVYENIWQFQIHNFTARSRFQ